MGTNNQMIAKQLQTLAACMPAMSDEDLLPAILDVCDGLLAEVQKRHPAVDQMDQVDLAQLMSGYSNISDHVGRFAGEVESSLGLENTRQRLIDSMQELERMKQQHTKDSLDLQTLQTDIDTQRRKNDVLENSVNQYKTTLDTLKNFYEGLLSMQEACSPEVIAAQKKTNAELMSQVNDQQKALKELEEEQQKQDRELADLRQKIGSVQETIDALPAENTRLLEEYDEKKAHLGRLQKAREDCSPEKQQELEEEIAKLQPLTEELKEKMAQLENHYKRLSEARTELDRQNQAMETNVLTLLTDSMGELNLLMTEHRSALAAIKKQADDYQKSLDECHEIRSGYADWCGTDREQLDAMLKALDQRESMELAKTLDVRCQTRIRRLFSQVEDSLKELDRILKDCAVATRKDQSDIERKAGTR